MNEYYIVYLPILKSNLSILAMVSDMRGTNKVEHQVDEDITMI